MSSDVIGIEMVGDDFITMSMNKHVAINIDISTVVMNFGETSGVAQCYGTAVIDGVDYPIHFTISNIGIGQLL